MVVFRRKMNKYPDLAVIGIMVGGDKNDKLKKEGIMSIKI